MSFAVLFGLLLTGTAAGRRPKKPARSGRISRRTGESSFQRGGYLLCGFHRPNGRRAGVNIIARVTGYLMQMPFKEGSEVKAWDFSFEIDPSSNQAQLDQAKSQVKLNEVQFQLAQTTLERYQELDNTHAGAVSKQAPDQYKAAVVEAVARVDAQKKSLEVYNLNKEFTHVVSPIDGQVSRYYLTLGNLVNQDQTLLTTIMSLDPMYVYFDMDERTLLQIRKAIPLAEITPPADGDTLDSVRVAKRGRFSP